MNAHETEAYEMGVQAAKDAAGWIIDGNTKREAIPAVLALLDAGDPRADEYLPACPTLSGEWADDLTPRSLYERVTGRELPPEGDEGLSFETDHGATLDALANAWELGVSETFAGECERLLRAAVDTHKCFGCDAQIADTPGNAYCADCIAKQTREAGDERAAFDAFHAYADRCARD